jgi:hypothetical protein
MADQWGAEVLGQDALIRVLLQAAGGAPQVLGEALHEEGQMAFRQTQKEVPVRKGYLKNSGRLSQPEGSGAGNVTVTITYGSSAADYAAPVHDLNKNYRNGRKWHYVADPVMGRVDGMEARLEKRIARILGRT